MHIGQIVSANEKRTHDREGALEGLSIVLEHPRPHVWGRDDEVEADGSQSPEQLDSFVCRAYAIVDSSNPVAMEVDEVPHAGTKANLSNPQSFVDDLLANRLR